MAWAHPVCSLVLSRRAEFDVLAPPDQRVHEEHTLYLLWSNLTSKPTVPGSNWGLKGPPCGGASHTADGRSRKSIPTPERPGVRSLNRSAPADPRHIDLESAVECNMRLHSPRPLYFEANAI